MTKVKSPHFNKTKIVATIGPATSSYDMLVQIIEAGVDVCRLNFSHGAYEDHQKVIDNINQYNAYFKSHVGKLLDLQGPKLRIGAVENDGIDLIKGRKLTVTTHSEVSTAERLSVNYEKLASEVKTGEKIQLDDGKLELKVLRTDGKSEIECIVVNGGRLTSRKGFNLPQTKTTLPCLTEKDRADLEFGLENNVDWVGLSFVRQAADILEVKNIIRQKGKHARVVAKIEKPEAVKNFDEILKVTDAVMVARGDLGVEMPMEEVPIIQKRIAEKCNAAGKPVIIATQMMESMIKSPTPTRAETTDIANAVLDGADAVMLSAETSVGDYPVKAVEYMTKIITHVEKYDEVYSKGKKPSKESDTFYSDEICFTACRISEHLNAKAIIGMTYSGYTGYKISSFRPRAPIFIFTSNQDLHTQMSLVWGVRTFFYDRYESTDQTFLDQIQILRERKLLKKNDTIIQTASMPIHARGRTNALKVTIVE